MTSIKKELALYIEKKCGIDANKTEQMFEYPPDDKMGDLSLPCFKLSKELRKAPQMIAQDIADGFSFDGVEKIDVVGGYLNFVISNDYYSGCMDGIISEGENYGKNTEGEGKTVVLDYSSPNVAKPFHLGHLGTTVIGQAIKNLLEFSGYKCIGINHLGDWGTSFGKQITAYKLWGSREMIEKEGVDGLVSLYQKFHEEAENKPELFDRAREEFTKLENGDEENTALWKWFIEISIEEYKKTYSMLDIDFDYYLGESFYTDKMPEQVEILREKNLLKIDDGASIVDLSEYGMPPCLILKKDGSTLYPTRDIAAAVYRYRTFNFDKCIYVTSAGQSLHFAQWFKVVELMGYDWYDRLVHVPYGTMSINGAKLGTRSGNVVWLKQLIQMSIDKVGEIIEQKNPGLPDKERVAQEVGVGAIIFYYLSNNRIKDISFDLQEALNFDGNTGPYVQYSYARTCSILEKAESDEGKVKIGEVSERALAKLLLQFPEKIGAALREYEPSVITRYIYDISAAYNRFYHDCRIIGCDDEATRISRVRLTSAANIVLKSALKLICMKPTEKI